MPTRSIAGEHLDQRLLHLGQQPARTRRRRGTARRRSRRPGRGWPGPAASGSARPRPSSPSPSSVSWPSSGAVDPQLAVQVAQRQVGQVVGALVGPGQVGGQRGVDGRRRRSCQPCAANASIAGLASCITLGRSGSASQAATAGLVGRRRARPGRTRRPGRRPVATAMPVSAPVPRPNVPATATPTGALGRRVLGQPGAPPRPAPSTAPARSKPASASGSTASRYS